MDGSGLHGHGELPLRADINVTSLMDIAFVLLIIFMITAPIMQGGVDISLPRADAQPVQPKEGLIVSVNREGLIFLDETGLTYEEFRVAFPRIVEARQASGVYLRGDQGARYGDVVRVLAVMRTSGISDVALVAEQELEGR